MNVMDSEAEFTKVIQKLQEKLKQKEDESSELRHEIEQHITHQKELGDESEYLRQKISAIQLDNTTLSNTQARLETQLYAYEQDLANARKEIQQLKKTKKDIENKLVSETQNFENDKLNWQQKEGELNNQIKSLLVGEPRRTGSTGTRRCSVISTEQTTLSNNSNNNNNNNNNGQLNSNNSADYYSRETKIAQRTIKAQDKLILDLKNELEKQKSLFKETQNEMQLQSLKMVHLEHETQNVKQLNRSLQEDNESYQILLHEKTMTGEFMANPIMQVETSTTSLNIDDNDNRRQSSGLNLAAELNMASDWNQKVEEDKTIKKLNEEIKTLQDTNRALQLYMNKILMKIINNKQLEDVLSIDQPKKEVPKQVNIAPQVTINGNSTPTPTKTISTTTSNNSNNNVSGGGTRPRRRTISYWGSKVPPTPATATDSNEPQQQVEHQQQQNEALNSAATSRHVRRHSTIMGEQSGSSGGWAKALRRMSGIGWSVPKEDNNNSSNSKNGSINNDSAVSSLSEEEKSTSGSSTPSLRHSSELGILAEEE